MVTLELPQLQFAPPGPPLQISVSPLCLLPKLLGVSLMHVKMAPTISPAYERVMKNATHYPDGRVEYRCSIHGPMWGDAVRTPQHPCEECWVMFAKKLEACTPPEERQELFERLQAVVMEANRLTERGNWDVQWTPPQHDPIALTDD